MIEMVVRGAIQKFEPRILRHNLEVTAVEVTEQRGANVVQLEIRGEVWNVPMPEALYIRTALDLETGRYQLNDQLHGQ